MQPMHIYITGRGRLFNSKPWYLCLVSVSRIVYRTSHIALVVSRLWIFFFPVTYIEQVLKKLKEVNYGSLATVVGRYYAMDRDKRWERIKIAYEALVQGIGETTTTDKVIEVYKKMYLIWVSMYLARKY